MVKIYFTHTKRYRTSKIQFTVCHQRSDRSFHFRGRQFPLCARCTGLMIGCFFYPLFLFNIIDIPIYLIVALHMPMIIDGLRQVYLNQESTNILRFVTGLLAGASQMALVDKLAKITAHIVVPLLRDFKQFYYS